MSATLGALVTKASQSYPNRLALFLFVLFVKLPFDWPRNNATAKTAKFGNERHIGTIQHNKLLSTKFNFWCSAWDDIRTELMLNLNK